MLDAVKNLEHELNALGNDGEGRRRDDQERLFVAPPQAVILIREGGSVPRERHTVDELVAAQ